MMMSCAQVLSLWTAASGTVGCRCGKAILTSVFRGLNLGPDRLVAIRHATALFNDKLARACIRQTMREHKVYQLLDTLLLQHPQNQQEHIYQAIRNNLRNAI